MSLQYHMTFLVWAWDALCFGATAFLAFRALRRHEYVWGGVLTGLLSLDLALIFLLHDLVTPSFLSESSRVFTDAIGDALEFAVPPLVMHLFYREERANLRRPMLWKGGLVAMYMACALGIAMTAIAPLVVEPWQPLRRLAHPARVAALAVSSAAVATLIWQTWHTNDDGAKRRFYGWLAPMFGLIVVLHFLEIARHVELVGAIQDLLPAGLLFVLAYQLQPLTFDVLIKEVTFYFFVLATVYTAWWILPVWFAHHEDAYPALILCVWPIISAAPWFHRKWIRWLDRAVFARKLTPSEARTYFLVGLERALTEEDLAQSGERTLQEIFGAPARILLKGGAAAQREAGMRVDIRVGGEICGCIDVAPRPRNLHFMGEDLALLTSLAAEFSILLDNLRLREMKIDQERKEKDLQILATRSELKALRAQINPHFLFNALSAIAGLVSKDPSRARETVEQLAEVFRYSLYRSEKEWVQLADEVEFVAAYLDVERARFGSRLQTEIRVDDAAGRLLVPAMVLQVLVENAIKHGVASVRGVGIVSVRGERRGPSLWLEVRDNGPGPGLPSTPRNGSSSGFGLRNVQDRLNLYFPGESTLRMCREDAMTVVTIEMPAETVLESKERVHR